MTSSKKGHLMASKKTKKVTLKRAGDWRANMRVKVDFGRYRYIQIYGKY